MTTKTKEEVIREIQEAFGANEYPGDQYLQGSVEGCEPYEVAEAFKGQTDWRAIDATILDGYSEALSFLSEEGLRFFFPAYMIADLDEKLMTADPVFPLTNGFHDNSVEVPTPKGPIVRRWGGSVLLNPRRYGAMRFGDHARYRLSIFTREEARAIVSYLVYKREADPDGFQSAAIDAALDGYWHERAQSAPTAADLRRHLDDERDYIDRISSSG